MNETQDITVRILIVAKVTPAIEALKHQLSKLNPGWEVALAPNGTEALHLLSHASFDVVLSETQVPDIHGVHILDHIRQQYPDVARIALTEREDSEGTLTALVAAQQFLSKQCTTEELMATIVRFCSLRHALSSMALRRLVSQVGFLPSLPTAYAEIMQELQSKEPSISRIGDIIAKDVGMTAKLLQLANSAWFAIRNHISSPAQAVSMLGLDKVKAFVLYYQIFSKFDRARIPGFSMENLATHSISTGMYAKLISETEQADPHMIDYAFLAGLLHDVGMLILVGDYAEQYTEVLTQGRQRGIPLAMVEKEILGTTHAELGAYLLASWGLPQPIVEAIAFHHCPSKGQGYSFTPLTAVHAANALVHENLSETDEGTRSLLDLDHLDTANLIDHIPIWRKLFATTHSA